MSVLPETLAYLPLSEDKFQILGEDIFQTAYDKHYIVYTSGLSAAVNSRIQLKEEFYMLDTDTLKSARISAYRRPWYPQISGQYLYSYTIKNDMYVLYCTDLNTLQEVPILDRSTEFSLQVAKNNLYYLGVRNNTIYVSDSAGNNYRKLNDYAITQLCYVGEGKLLAFGDTGATEGSAKAKEIFMINLDGSGLELLPTS